MHVKSYHTLTLGIKRYHTSTNARSAGANKFYHKKQEPMSRVEVIEKKILGRKIIALRKIP